MNLEEMITKKEAVEYIKKQTNIFDNSNNISVKSLNSNTLSVNGYANNLFLIENKTNRKKIVLKQVLPYVRKAALENVEIPLPRERIYSEFYSLKFWSQSCPGYVPEVYFFDSNNNIIIFEYIEKMFLLRSALIKRKRFENIDDKIASFLAKTAFYSSKYFLKEKEFNGLLNFFNKSDTINVWDDLIFIRAILNPQNRSINPSIRDKVLDYRQDQTIIRKTKKIRSVFKNKRISLMHGDFHSSNIFVEKNKIKIFDTEFAGYGLPAFDMGRLIGNLLLNYSSLIGLNYSVHRKKYQSYILKLISNIYNLFKHKLSKLIHRKSNSLFMSLEEYFNEYFYQMLSFASLTIISRLYNEGLCLDLKKIEDIKKRTVAQELAIKLSKVIFYNNEKIKSMDELIIMIEKINYSFQYNKIKNWVIKAAQ
jgi:5-methylthioribose kinase